MTNAGEQYCFGRTFEGAEDEAILNTFDDVIRFLGDRRNAQANELADDRADRELVERERVGGFGVLLRNRWDSEIEVGVGHDVWFLFRHQPRPGRSFSDNPQLDDHLVFYLGGGHYSELRSDQLVSRVACLAVIRRWLDYNQFPESLE